MRGDSHAMRVLLFSLTVGLVAASSEAFAQQTGGAVQLPTFSFFSVNTTVSVPDSGAGIAAAMRRAEANRIMFGGAAHEKKVGMGNVAVNAVIHDRMSGPGLVLQKGSAVASEEWNFSRRMDAAQGSSAGRADRSVAEIVRLRRHADSRQQTTAQRYFQRGIAAESKGRLGVAAIYYRQAATRAHGDLRTAAMDRFRAVASNR